MKKIFNILLLAVFTLSVFTACEKDDDSNPVLKEPTTFSLNLPPYAANNIYDLKNAKTVELTCSQPDYGFPAATTYSVQVALNSEFTEKTEESEANYTELTTTYSTAKMDVVASELNTAIIELWTAQNVLGNASTDKLEAPQTMFLVGSMLDTEWTIWKPMVQVSGLDGQFWRLIYFTAGDEFKFGTKEKEYIGSDDTRLTITDKAESGVIGTNSGNITVKNAGWYVVFIKAAVKGSDYTFTMTFYPGEVYLFGATNGGTWDYNDTWKFTAPDNKDGSFVSPAMTASGEARICVKTDVDWWRTEFTLCNGEIFYRENNPVNDSWGKDVGPEYSIQGAAGKTIRLNFTAGTGELK